MKKNSKVIILISIMLLSIFIVSCKTNNDKKNKSSNNINELTKNMIKEDVDSLLGEPKEDVGSGLSVYVYRIDDFTVLASFNAEDKLISAILQKNDGTEKQLIEQDK
jgi:hypothetical protein